VAEEIDNAKNNNMRFIFTVLIFFAFGYTVIGQSSSKEFKIKKGQTYLNLPVSNSARLVRARLKIGDRTLDQFTIKLAEADPDFWVFFFVTAYQGKSIVMEIENYTPPNFGGTQPTPTTISNEALPVKALDLVHADVKFPGMDSLYKESKRPQVHFTARRGWINDPNGLVYHNGEYHLYFQHNPYGWPWGNMHWGHAVSRDLLRWQELNDAIFPMLNLEGNRQDAAFSGSAVVDLKNTAGFRKNGIDPIIAVYTSTGRGECLKLSYDNGRTFSEYEGNPILKHSGRDPKVLWYEPGNHWVMVVWDNGEKKKLSLGQEAVINQHLIYTSPDLKNWTRQSGVEGFFECPELFELPVEGQTGVSKWVMYDATGRYVVGDFNGKEFKIDQHLKKYEHGGAYFYASQTYNNTPDNRRIQIGWGRNITHPGMPFNQPQLFPTELKLRQTFDGLRLCPVPISEISTLHENSKVIDDKILTADEGVSVTVDGDPVHVVAYFEKGDAQFALNVLGFEIAYHDLLGELITTINNGKSNTAAPSGPFPPPSTALATINYIKPSEEVMKIEVIVDRNIIEFFVNDGEVYYAAPFNEEKTNTIEASVKGRGGNRKSILKKMEVHELKSIWFEK
jgi:fructan beta-fructosidase